MRYALMKEITEIVFLFAADRLTILCTESSSIITIRESSKEVGQLS